MYINVLRIWLDIAYEIFKLIMINVFLKEHFFFHNMTEIVFSFKGRGDSYSMNNDYLTQSSTRLDLVKSKTDRAHLQFSTSIPSQDLGNLKESLKRFEKEYKRLDGGSSIKILLWGDNHKVHKRYDCISLKELYNALPYRENIDTLILDGNLKIIKEKQNIPQEFTQNLKRLIVHGFTESDVSEVGGGMRTTELFNCLTDFNSLFEADSIDVEEFSFDMNANWSKNFKIKTKNLKIHYRES